MRISVGVVIIVLGLALTLPLTAQSSTIDGFVVDEHGPVAGAHVRVRATENVVFTDETGHFTLETDLAEQEVEITAWADGYYIASIHVAPPVGNILLTLRPYHTSDNSEYTWGLPIGDVDSGACSNCHPMIIDQWYNNAHGQAISNDRFYSLYNGTTLDGTTPVTPGYVTDFPNTAGTCANCHAPGAAIDGYLTVNMNDIRDEITAGIHCDFCHKIGGAYLNPATQMPYSNAPGVQSQRVLRPPADDNIFFGPYDDIHDPDTYLPIISESAFCASCHQFSMWGTPIYESYAEWLNSPYGEDNVTCQDCHMPLNGDTMFATLEAGGLEHPPETIPAHLQLGASSVGLLQGAVTMSLETQQQEAQLVITVAVENSNVGHHVPTDFPGRHLILVVQAVDTSGQSLTLVDGEVIPEWGGPQSGLPGKIYAKVLRDVVTGEMPVVSYWNRTQIVTDNRLAAFAVDTSTYHFALPQQVDEVYITATLIFRRVFYDVLVTREWDTPDIVISKADTRISPP